MTREIEPLTPPPLLTPAEESFERARRTISLIAGPALFALILTLPMSGLTPPQHRLTAVLLWVLTYWIGEAIPIPATALLGPVLCILMGIAEPTAVFAPFANPIVFLFLGSFILAEGMITHRLNERIALTVLSARWLVARGRRLAIAVGLIPLMISMWISDSATTAMIYPILLGILATLRTSEGGRQGRRFEAGLLLTISYAALIGGVGTPVGTPPNLIGLGMLDKLAGVRIQFFQWMLLAVPTLLVLAACMFAYMSAIFPSPKIDGSSIATYVRGQRRELGAWTRGEKNTLTAFLVAVVLWVFPGIAASISGPQSDLFKFCERHIPEGVASLVAALLLFLLPTDWKARRFTLRLSDALRIDWGTILLFGGGLSLGSLMFSSGLADVFGHSVIAFSGVSSMWGLTAIAIALAILLTEMTSNTATASMLVPVIIALAKSMAVSPVPPVIGVCLGASMAFMLPVSTPSNAIVYGSGRVPITSMIRAGVALDVMSFAVILGMLRLLCPALGLI
jgi:sodium-dependent dicarboxylate transporter 2/3/5